MLRDSWLKTTSSMMLVFCLLSFCAWCVIDTTPPPKVAQADPDQVIVICSTYGMSAQTVRSNYELVERNIVAEYEKQAKGEQP